MNSKENSVFKQSLGIFFRHIATLIIMIFVVFYPFSVLLVKNDNLTLQIICAVVFLLSYSVPIYIGMWSIGNKDFHKQKIDNSKKELFKGFKIGLIASIPNFIVAIIFILSKLNLFPYNITIIFKFTNIELLPLINMISNKIYLPDLSLLQVISMSLLTLIPSILCGIYYIVGNYDINLSQRLVYKENKDNNI